MATLEMQYLHEKIQNGEFDSFALQNWAEENGIEAKLAHQLITMACAIQKREMLIVAKDQVDSLLYWLDRKS